MNKLQVSTKIVQESYHSDGIPLNWAVFDINFPAGQDIFVQVSYVTDVQNSAAPNIEYVLGTGAGWYQSIGTATITLLFPYAVSMANILWFKNSDAIPENVVLIGNEIRWHWKSYEPATDEIVSVSVVHPADWQNILSLESKTGINPDDIDSAIELSQKYQRAGSNKDYISTPRLADLAEITIEQALALHPNDIRLHLELAKIYQQRYWLSKPSSENPYAQKLQDEINIILAIEPTNQRALEQKAYLEQDLATSQAPTPFASPTKVLAIKTPTSGTIETSAIPPLQATAFPQVAKGNKSDFQFLTWVFLLIIGFVMGTIFTKKRQKPS